MRVATRLLILKLALAAALIAAVVLAMHLLLPGLTGRGKPAAGGASAVAETAAVRVSLPCEAPAGLPAGLAAAQDLARQLDTFLKLFSAEYAKALDPEPPAAKLAVHVLPTYAEALALATGAMRQDPADPSGFYDPEKGTIAAMNRPFRNLVGALVRLATRLLMARSAGGRARWSPWLAEGLAVYLEQGATGAGTMRLGGVNRRDAAVVLALAGRNAHVPLRMLTSGGPELFAGPLGALAYREAALLVPFLLWGKDPSHRDAFLRYLALERQPGPVPHGALENTLGTDLTALEKQWLAFLQTIAR